mgnify:CR=1 FL=1
MEIIFPFILGIILGFVIQKGYLCCYEGLTTALIIKNYQRIKIIIWAVLTAMLFYHILAGFGIISLVSQPFFWPGVIIGGILFGIGMVIAGGCMLGVFLKTGNGLINYLIVVMGIFLGLGLGKFLILEGPIEEFYQLGLPNPELPAPTLSSWLHLNSWIVVIFLSFLLIWFLYKFKNPKIENNLELKKESLGAKFFKKHWPVSTTGIIFGFLMTIGFARWNVPFFPTFFQNTSSLDTILTQLPVFLWFLLTFSGILLGIIISSVISGEFRIRWIKLDKKRLSSAFSGGLIMGFGMVLANGCNTVHLFVLLPQLSLGSFLAIIIMSATVWLATHLRLNLIFNR